MRMPVRSERDAFRIAWGTVVLVAASVALGALIEPLVGVALFVVVLIGAVVWDVRTPNPGHVNVLDEAAHMGRDRAADDGPRLRVVDNQTRAGGELRNEVLRREPRPELRVDTPVL